MSQFGRKVASEMVADASLLRGVLAGLLATVPMTAVMLLLYRYLPVWQRYDLPPEQITAELGEEAGARWNELEHDIITWTGHFIFGAAMGGIYGVLSGRFLAPILMKGGIFGLAVWAVNYLGILPAARILPSATEHPHQRNLLMIAAHLVWGWVTAWLVTMFQERTGPAPINQRKNGGGSV